MSLHEITRFNDDPRINVAKEITNIPCINIYTHCEYTSIRERNIAAAERICRKGEEQGEKRNEEEKKKK